jgi:hypothetical protein
MESKSSKSEVESKLHETAEAMSERLSSLQEELSTSGESVRMWIVQNPVKSVGGMLAAGMAVGLLFGGNRSTRKKRHTQLIDAYLDALRQQVEGAVDQGDEPGPAVEKALRERVPMIVYSNGKQQAKEGRGRRFLWEAGEIIFSTGLSLVVREVIESMLSSIDVEAIVEEELVE